MYSWCVTAVQGTSYFRQITDMHRGLGVDLNMCVAFLEAVFQAVAHRLGSKATTEVLACWSCQLLFISRAMAISFQELSSEKTKLACPQRDVTGYSASSKATSEVLDATLEQLQCVDTMSVSAVVHSD